MRWNDDWIITTTGHKTTTAIRAIAGPIQSSGVAARARPRNGEVRGAMLSPYVYDGVFGLPVPGRDRSGRAPGCSQLALVAVCWSWPRTCFGSPVTAVPMVCWILVLVLAQP